MDADAPATSASTQDERDAIIERLEHALAEERKNAASLREAADALRFKAEILEKSYAKQLADARERAAAAERALAEHGANVAAYGENRDETIRLLEAARAELAEVKLDRDQLARQLAARSGSHNRAEPSHVATHVEGTINQLIAAADWGKKPREAAGTGSHADARVALEQDAPYTDMLPPELVFTKDKDD